MFTVPAMYELCTAVLLAFCAVTCPAAVAQDVYTRSQASADTPAHSMHARNLLAPDQPAPSMPARAILVQDLPPDLTREQVILALQSRDREVRSGAYVALGLLGIHDDLPLLFIALYDDDRLIRSIAEQSIWRVWGRSGDPAHDRLYRYGVEQMQSGELSRAVGSFTALIELAPDFAEAWNKRATLYFMLGENDLSIADCEQVLAREPNHFGALSGYGQLMLRQGEFGRALDYFEQALTANPNMPGVRNNIRMIRELLEHKEGNGV